MGNIPYLPECFLNQEFKIFWDDLNTSQLSRKAGYGYIVYKWDNYRDH